MSTINLNAVLDRLKTFFKVDSDAELARRLRVTPARFSNWRQRGSMSLLLLLNLVKGVNLHWLLTGEGPMLPGKDSELVSDEEKRLLEFFRTATPEARAMVLAALKSSAEGTTRHRTRKTGPGIDKPRK